MNRVMMLVPCFMIFLVPLISASQIGASPLPWVKVAPDQKGFVLDPGGSSFVPWGFNYDRDDSARLLEDYWEAGWPDVVAHFTRMKAMGANVVRVHLQLGSFMESPRKPRARALDRLGQLVRLAERLRLYLDLTGLGCYHAKDVPVWYDRLSESDRWDVQARFWRAVAEKTRNSPAVFCYDLMNEPVVSGTRRSDGNWLAAAWAGSCFVQFITLDPGNRTRSDIARQWMRRLVSAIRDVDRRHLITVGLLDWSSDRPGSLSGFLPEVVSPEVDFVSVHIYPEKGKVEELVRAFKSFAVGKPVLVEEMFPLRCSAQELEQFIDESKDTAAGWLGFYWGKPPEELRKSKTIVDALTLGWLEMFQRKAAEIGAPRAQRALPMSAR